MRLREKTAVVTGGASGIGAAAGRLMAKEGAMVILTDVNDERGEAVADAIRSGGGQAEFRHLDVTAPSDWDALAQYVESTDAELNIMVNNAGRGMIQDIESLTLSDWQSIMRVNLDSVFLGTQMALRLMKSHDDGGSIINVSSIYGLLGESLTPAYSASKGGVRLFSKSVAMYCCERGYAIRCNSIHPGFVETRLAETSQVQAAESDLAALEARIANGIPMGTWAVPDQIASGIVFLASDESSYMTGSELVIDGGYSAH